MGFLPIAINITKGADNVVFSTVAVALWAMTPNVPITPNLQLTLDAVYEGGVGNVQVDNPVWSPEGRE